MAPGRCGAVAAALVCTALAALALGVAADVDVACTRACADAAPPTGCTALDPASATDPAQNLTLTTCVTAGPGQYLFTYVNVLDGGVLWFEDAGGLVDFRASSVLVERGGRVVAGRWCRPFGCGGGTLQIGLWGTDPTHEGTVATAVGIQCLTPGGCYDAALPGVACCNVSTAADGAVDPCTDAVSCSADTTNANALFEGYSPDGLAFDGPGNLFGFKVFAVSYGGSLELFGRNGVAADDLVDPDPNISPRPTACDVPTDLYSSKAWAALTGESWTRLGATASAGATLIELDRPVTWAQGTLLVVTTTSWFPSHNEVVQVAADVVNATTIPLAAPLQFDHFGNLIPMEAQWSNVSFNPNADVDLRAAVGVLSRSIKVYSLGQTALEPFPSSAACTVGATPVNHACYFGGHTIVRQGFARYQVQGVEFHQLGQGGRMGHYPVHFHLAKQVYYTSAFVKDSSSWDSMTRFFVVHGTHGVAVERNVGYLSVGHGYYLEDATEINNVVCHNLAATLRAPLLAYLAAQSPTSPTARAIPGILPTVGPNPGLMTGGDEYQPVGFWTMNMWNDITGNMVAGVLGWGSCFWLLGSHMSGNSRVLRWTHLTGTEEDYARWGASGGARIAPIKRFRANSCPTAALGLQTALPTYPADAPSTGFAGSGPYGKAVVINPYMQDPDMFPKVDQNFSPTRVSNSSIYFINEFRTCARGVQLVQYPPQAATDIYAQNPELCSAAVISRFRTSFNWAEVNFGSIWLRGFWFLVQDSVVTDQAFGGLSFVTGGSWLDALPGFWMLVHNSIFLGSSQPFSATAGRTGPSFDANACVGAVCPIPAEGIALNTAGFNPARLITIYDGPFFADGNIFIQTPNFTCNPALGNVSCGIYRSTVQPLSDDSTDDTPLMNVVSAAIGWKVCASMGCFGGGDGGRGGSQARATEGLRRGRGGRDCGSEPPPAGHSIDGLQC